MNPSNHIPYILHLTWLKRFTNDVWLWFILSIDVVSVTVYTIPTSISFFKKKFLKFYFGKFLGVQKCNLGRVSIRACKPKQV